MGHEQRLQAQAFSERAQWEHTANDFKQARDSNDSNEREQVDDAVLAATATGGVAADILTPAGAVMTAVGSQTTTGLQVAQVGHAVGHGVPHLLGHAHNVANVVSDAHHTAVIIPTALQTAGEVIEKAGHFLIPISLAFDLITIVTTIANKERYPRENVTGIAVPIIHASLVAGCGIAVVCAAPAATFGLGTAGVAVGIGNSIARLCFWRKEKARNKDHSS